MKRLWRFALMGLTVLLGPFENPAFSKNSFPPAKETPAYERFVKGPQTEFAKLLYLLERFRNTNFAVIFAGTIYDANTAIRLGRTYLLHNYNREQADEWLKIHTYYAGPDGQLIYAIYPGGKRRPVGDLLLEELDSLNNTVQSKDK